MAEEAYENVMRGKLSLKGSPGLKTIGGAVKKKKKKNKSKMAKADEEHRKDIASSESPSEAAQDTDELEDDRTPAQKRYDEYMAKRERDIVGKAAAKTHKEKIDKFNDYLATLTEHHDIPKVGPG